MGTYIKKFATEAAYQAAAANLPTPNVCWIPNGEVHYNPYVYIPEAITFADSAVKALLVANYDTNNDGEIDTDEAAAVTSFGGNEGNTEFTPFYGNTTITSFDEGVYFTGLTDLYNVLRGCSNLTSAAFAPSSSSAIPFNGLFTNCTSLTSATLSGVASKMANVFYKCTSLQSIDLSNVDVSHCSTFQNLFAECTNLQTIILDGWEIYTSAVAAYFVTKCTSLTSVRMNGCSNASVRWVQNKIAASSNMSSSITITQDSNTYTWNGSAWSAYADE